MKIIPVLIWSMCTFHDKKQLQQNAEALLHEFNLI